MKVCSEYHVHICYLDTCRVCPVCFLRTEYNAQVKELVRTINTLRKMDKEKK